MLDQTGSFFVMSKLPKRWRLIGKNYYYQVPKGLEYFWDDKTTFLLGKNLSEAYKNWRNRFDSVEEIKTINDLLDRYSLEVLPCKSPTTQRRQALHIETLRCVFGHMPVDALLPYHVYQYYEKRSQKIEKLSGKVEDYLVVTYDAEQRVGGSFWDRVAGGDLHNQKSKRGKMWKLDD